MLVLTLFGLWLHAAAVEGCEGTGEGDYRVVELRRADASLLLFGARHRTDPSDPIFAELDRRIAAFRPTVVLVEGQAPAQEPPTRQIAIEHRGEDGLLCWLAKERNVPCRNMDLTEAEEARRLMKRHGPDEVLLFFVVRVLAYFNPRPPSQRPPGDLVAWAIRRYGPLVGRADATAADLARTCQAALHRPWEPGSVTTEWHDPRKSELLTQRMSRETNELREPYMIEQLLAAATSGARVFAAVGEGHVCNVRAELRARWNQAAPRP